MATGAGDARRALFQPSRERAAWRALLAEVEALCDRVAVLTARPGLIKCDWPVPLPHPRHYAMKTTPQFMQLKAHLTEEIRAEVRRAA